LKAHLGIVIVALLLALPAGLVGAQGWSLKDSGVGLVIQDADYDKQLKIAARGTAWDLEELYAGGALAGKYRGNQVFAAWLAGPPTGAFLNSSGLPAWNYKYKFTFPNGTTFEGGPYGFYTPGFATVGISIGGGTAGSWKIDWYIVHRATKEVRPVATNEFTTTWGKPKQETAAGWALKDSGVGLIVVDGEYDKQLKIVERGSSWNLQELYAGGALANKYRGHQGFYAGLVGPPTDTFLNSSGLPVWNYKYKLTFPNGTTYEGGPAGFYAPGFAAVAISIGGGTSGAWKIDWYIVNRDTQEGRHVAASEFTTTW